MNNMLAFTLSLLMMFSLSAQTNFGRAVNKSTLTSISVLLASPQKYINKEVTISGTIVSVCKKRGCWMKFASDKKYQDLRIKVKDGDMVFPFSARGKKGYATGKLVAKELSIAHAKKYLSHMAHEAGKKFDQNSVKAPVTIYQFAPVGVIIE